MQVALLALLSHDADDEDEDEDEDDDDEEDDSGVSVVWLHGTSWLQSPNIWALCT